MEKLVVKIMGFKRIAVVGEIASGKDTVATYFKEHQRITFGDPIKEIVKAVRTGGLSYATGFAMSMFKMEDLAYHQLLGDILFEVWSIPKKDSKDREAVQYLGTTMRKIYPDVWIDLALEKVVALGAAALIITDCRKFNELKALREIGFTMIYVDASTESRKRRAQLRDGLSEEDFLEASEREAERGIRELRPLCKYVVNNSADSLDDLYRQLTIIEGRNR